MHGLAPCNSESNSLSMRTLAVRMRSLPCLFRVAILLLMMTHDAAWASVFLVSRRLLCHVADRVLHFLLRAVFGFVPRLATVVALAFEFGTSSFFPVTTLERLIYPTGWPINTIHRRDERRVGGDKLFQLHAIACLDQLYLNCCR